MRANDPSHRALLSVLLLYDLVAPTTLDGDTFSVLTFDPDPGWLWSPGAAPPTSTGPSIDARNAAGAFHRGDFADRIGGLRNEAAHTYFLPGLNRTADDLRTAGSPVDDRVIVLLTDGLPEAATQAEEQHRIQSDILPILRDNNIDLHVIAFGPVARSKASYFQEMVGGASPLGGVHVDADGSGLPAATLNLFAQAFGYSPTEPIPTAGGYRADLASGELPDHAYVVVYDRGPGAPALELSSEAGAPEVLAPDGDRRGELPGAGASYHLLKIQSPAPGVHRLATTAAHALVLRPLSWQLSLTSPPEEVIAGYPTDFGLVLANRSGATGIEEAVIQGITLEGALRAQSDPTDLGRWDGELGRGGWLSVRPNASGHAVLSTTFTSRGSQAYPGAIELLAQHTSPGTTGRQQLVVGSLLHQVVVHPFLHIQPQDAESGAPRISFNGGLALKAEDRVCGSLRLHRTTANGATDPAPPPGDAPYPLRATLGTPAFTPVAPRAGLLDPRDALGRDTRFTLDGHPLPFQDDAGAVTLEELGRPQWAWLNGRPLTAAALDAPLSLCVEVGNATAAGTVEIPLELVWGRAPYDDPRFAVIETMTLELRLTPASAWTRLSMTSLLALMLLLLGAAALLLRGRLGLPADLGAAYGQPGAPLQRVTLGPQRLWSTLFGQVGRRRIYATDGTCLGELEALPGDLFRFRVEGNVSFSAIDGPPVAQTSEGVILQAGRQYQIQRDGRHVRLVFDFGTPK